ncbi:MAG: flavodoxin family protein [Armatimonadetes bacterium]|nr:flavodoxin family protein [Armatimonadota bacterium]MDW8120688.1 flavodoxin family protein [Armatimonadota bacterium]
MPSVHKVLGIMGSSRRDGNTNDLLDVALKAAEEEGASVSKIVLLDYTLHHIQDCKVCKMRGACVNEDDLMKLISPLLEADVHIWASPVYWYSVSGLTKVLLDRFSCFLYWYPEVRFAERMAGKGAAIITVQEETGVERAQDLLGCLQKSFAFLKQEYLGFVLGPGGKRGTALKDQEAVRQARELGKRCAHFVRKRG